MKGLYLVTPDWDDTQAMLAATQAALEGGLDLGQRLADAESKLAEMQDAFLRAKADAENIRRRAQEDISKAHKFAVEFFAESLLPVKDSLEMALKIETPSIESLKEGVDMTLKQLSSAFEKNRLLEVNPQQGEKLDPMKHQAISMVPAVGWSMPASRFSARLLPTGSRRRASVALNGLPASTSRNGRPATPWTPSACAIASWNSADRPWGWHLSQHAQCA